MRPQDIPIQPLIVTTFNTRAAVYPIRIDPPTQGLHVAACRYQIEPGSGRALFFAVLGWVSTVAVAASICQHNNFNSFADNVSSICVVRKAPFWTVPIYLIDWRIQPITLGGNDDSVQGT